MSVLQLLTKASARTTEPATGHPFFAIVGVLLGALISVFTGRLLSIGLADVQGAIGADSDSMSWLSTAFNAANMFIGPLTVFLGALYGARRILLWASALFMLCEFLSPFVGDNITALTILQLIAGLAAGTYYPLTFTAIVRNLPLRLIHLGIAAYALDILASTHIATMLESWYITNLSWHWIFWNALLVTPLFMVCIYIGIPRQPLPASGPKTNLWGYLYASTAFTCLYCALDQGQRLDWINSGVISAFICTGLFMLAVTIFRRWRQPHPLINLRFLLSRNLLLLGAVLICFRFLLLAPTLLVPSYLSLLNGYRPEQTGGVLAWTAAIELIAAPVAGLLLYRVDSRLMCAIGFMLSGISCLICSGATPDWTGETFVTSQIINSIGIAFALTGLIASILRSAMALGVLKSPVDMLTLSCWFQTCRLFGAEIGKTLLLRFLTVQGLYHYTVLAQNIDGGWLTDERIRQSATNLIGLGASLADDKARAVHALGESLHQQVGGLAITDGFRLIAISALFCIILIASMAYAPPIVER
jgi:DHA2 family multidrug resistance protein